MNRCPLKVIECSIQAELQALPRLPGLKQQLRAIQLCVSRVLGRTVHCRRQKGLRPAGLHRVYVFSVDPHRMTKPATIGGVTGSALHLRPKTEDAS